MLRKTSQALPHIYVVRHSRSEAEPSAGEPVVTSDSDTPVAMGNSLDCDSLYKEFAPLVRRLIRQFGQDTDMREDLAGELYDRFRSLVEAFDPGRGAPLYPYLVRQLSLAAYAYARRQEDVPCRETEEAVAFRPTEDWSAALARDQASSPLPAAMENLPVRQRSVLIWRYYEERSFEEIAEILAVQPGTARSLLRRGLDNLRKAIRSADCL